MSEIKHKYVNFNKDTAGLTVDMTGTTEYNRRFRYGAPVSIGDITCYNPIFPEVGAGDNQRIGKQIFLKDIQFYGRIRPVLSETFNKQLKKFKSSSTGVNVDHYVPVYNPVLPIRVMAVEFDDKIGSWSNPLDATDFKIWFNNVFVPDVSIGQAHYLEKRLRESTKYTGHFKILYDQVFRLGNEPQPISIDLKFNSKYQFNESTSLYPLNNLIEFFVIVPWSEGYLSTNPRNDITENIKSWFYAMDYLGNFNLTEVDVPMIELNMTSKISYRDS